MSVNDQPLDIVVRFSTSNADVVLNALHPSTTSVVALKQRIRTKISAPASESRLRLIYAGKVLVDASALSQSLHASAPPPPIARSGENGKSQSKKAKGKQPLRDEGQQMEKAVSVRVYVHCAIGDILSTTDLAIEARQAQEADEVLRLQIPAATTTTTTTTTDEDGSKDSSTTTTPAPRGFDRLLTAGFTAPEIATLRTQFLAIQAHTHTPDTMPSGHALLALEERWLDNGSNSATTGEVGGFEAEDAGGLDDMLWGNLIGFFWPVGAMCWLMREEGVWTRRRQIAVLSGFLVNLTFGVLRVMN